MQDITSAMNVHYDDLEDHLKLHDPVTAFEITKIMKALASQNPE